MPDHGHGPYLNKTLKLGHHFYPQMAGMLGSTVLLADAQPQEKQDAKQQPHGSQYTWDISWRNVAVFIYIHGATLHGIYLGLTGQIMLYTFLWCM